MSFAFQAMLINPLAPFVLVESYPIQDPFRISARGLINSAQVLFHSFCTGQCTIPHSFIPLENQVLGGSSYDISQWYPYLAYSSGSSV